LTTASGDKMGKTAQGAVWLNAERLSPYEYWQFWRNTEDADVGRFLRLFTELPLDEIARLEALGGGEINEAKKILATEATALCHGRDAAEAAARTANAVFGSLNVTFPNFTLHATGVVESGIELPQITVPRDELRRGIAVFELFNRAGLAASNGEARRLIRGGGARINDAVVEDEMRLVRLDDLGPDGGIKLSAGRKRHVFVRPE
jgi:tyrosyl-tRNA synthetase